jgi:hypothetical protein
MNIYVASSWRNSYQPGIVALLREHGHDVYDFRNPAPGNHGFAWSDIDPHWLKWGPAAFRLALSHPVAVDGFRLDMTALERCDACLCVLPCGRSAHLELGWAAGAGKLTAIYIPEPQEPELMYRMLGSVLVDRDGIVEWARP